MPAGRDDLIQALDELRHALERERQANSDEARGAAQEAAIAGWQALGAGLGIQDLLQRRVVAQVQGVPATASVAASALPGLMGNGHGQVGARAARHAAMQVVLDSGVLPPRSAELIAGALIAAGAGCSLFDPAPVAGVDPASGPWLFARFSIVNALGYEAGATGREKKLLPQRNLELARQHYLALARAARGRMPADITKETIRDWCTRASELKDSFKRAHTQGLADRAAGAIKPELLLSGLVIPTSRPA